jgi:hypothetical protein
VQGRLWIVHGVEWLRGVEWVDGLGEALVVALALYVDVHPRSWSGFWMSDSTLVWMSDSALR